MEVLFFVLLGMTIDRYIMPIIDIGLEYISHKVNKTVVMLSLDTQREQLKFNKEVESTDDQHTIGFEHPGVSYVEETEEDEEDNHKMGFKMFKQNKQNNKKLKETQL